MLQRFESFVTGITTCYKYIQRIKNMEMTEFGLKGTHVMCLFYLNHNPQGLTATELSQLCCEDKAAISRTLNTLQEKGLIRNRDQKYRAQLVLTPAGSTLANTMNALISQWVTLGGDGLTDEERNAFYQSLRLISENLKTKLKDN